MSSQDSPATARLMPDISVALFGLGTLGADDLPGDRRHGYWVPRPGNVVVYRTDLLNRDREYRTAMVRPPAFFDETSTGTSTSAFARLDRPLQVSLWG